MKVLRQRMQAERLGESPRFRWRGTQVTRIEALTDGVFALAITLLVVSVEVPRTFGELLRTMQGFGAFAVTFGAIVGIWYAHYSFFRQYGLADGVIVVLNSILLFVVLFYIYPLKFLFSYLIDHLLLRLAFGLEPATELEIRGEQISLLMVTYSMGFLLVFLVFALMHLHAYRKRAELGLDAVEVWQTRVAVQANLLSVAVAAVSVALAAVGTRASTPMAGWIYLLVGPLQWAHGVAMGRLGRRRLGPAWAREETE